MLHTVFVIIFVQYKLYQCGQIKTLTLSGLIEVCKQSMSLQHSFIHQEFAKYLFKSVSILIYCYWINSLRNNNFASIAAWKTNRYFYGR